jgi:hypothetical protein
LQSILTRREKTVRSERLAGANRPLAEIVAPVAVPHIEEEPDDREKHRMGAIQQLAVLGGLEAQFRKYLGGAPTVPAETMTNLWFQSECDTHIRDITTLPNGRPDVPRTISTFLDRVCEPGPSNLS